MNHGNLSEKLHMEPRMESGKPTRLKTALIGTLHTYVILVLAILCALWMAEDVFSEITLSTEALVQVFLMLLPMAILVGIVAEYWRRMRLLWRYLVPAIYFGALFYYGYHHAEDLLKGIHYLSAPILQAVNAYYKTNFVIYGGGWFYADTTLAFILLCVSVFFLTEALWCYKRILLVLFPILVLACEMAVGQTPQPRSMVLLFVTVLLCGLGGWEGASHPAERVTRQTLWQRLRSVLVPAGMFAVCLLMGGVALRTPEKQIAEYGATVRQWQWDMEDYAEAAFRRLLAGVGRENWSDVTNLSPHYSDTEVLRVTFSEDPLLSGLYLRGYYGKDYENGQWSCDEEAFDELWETLGNGESITAYASYQRAWYSSSSDPIRLDYIALNTTTVYVPFTVNVSTLEDGLTLTGEYVVKKPKGMRSVTYEYRSIDSTIWYKWLTISSYTSSNAGFHTSSDTAAAYTEYVEENYLDVPDSLAVTAEIADEILSSSDYAETSADEWENEDKYFLATLVANYMSGWTYSLELDGVPDGSDVVAYFLTESHTGYCVHYATAATMILRQMGIPARFAAGYLCRTDNGTLNEDGEYEVSVLDSDAHAWVEIYMEGIGWYPVEVTAPAGGAAGQLASIAAMESGSKEWENLWDSELSDASEQEDSQEASQQEETQEQQSEPETQDQDENEDNSQENGNGNGSSNAGASDDTSGSAQIGRKMAIALGVLLLVAAVVGVIVACGVTSSQRREKRALTRIRRSIRAGNHRRAIYSINQMIYRQLRRKTHAVTKRMTDREYAKLLEKHFPQDEPFAWEKYVEIVQKCVFSKEEITEEEAQYCEQMMGAILRRT